MTHKDHERLHKVRYRWQKEQQLIREKYKIPYNMTYTSQRSVTLQAEFLFKQKQSNNLQRRACLSDEYRLNNDPNIPPMYCSKCHVHITKCSCLNGFGQWWIDLENKSRSTEKLPKNSVYDRHVIFDLSLTDRTNTEKTRSNNKQLFVLLDWNNYQSLRTFIRTIQPTKHLSNITIEQLRELITDNDNIHLFNSIIDLILSMNDEQRRSFHCHIYIDPSYYSAIQGATPLSQSRLIADNINLTRAPSGIQTIANLLGVKSIDKFLQKNTSRNIPYHTVRNTSVCSQ